MKEIFISYSTIDAAQAEMIRKILESNGFSCWMAPRDIPGGSNYTKEIPIAIRNCKIFLLVLSTHSQGSHWVLKELDAAVNNSKIILPFMLEEFDLNDEFNFLLSGTQRYTAYQKKADTVEALISRIRAIVSVDNHPETAAREETQQETAQQETVHQVIIPPAAAPAKAASQLVESSCPACHSTELKPLPKKFKLENSGELIFKCLPAIMGVLCGFIGLIIMALIPVSAEVIILGITAGIVGGVFWGRHMALTKVTQHRLRQRMQVTCYCCNRCKKIFNITETLE